MGHDIYINVERRISEGSNWFNVPSPNDWHMDRYYKLFVMLGYNHDTLTFTQPFNLISIPKGMPVDADQPTRENIDDWQYISYLTLEEILKFDWTQTIDTNGYMDFEDWKDWFDDYKPRGIAPQYELSLGSYDNHIKEADAIELRSKNRKTLKPVFVEHGEPYYLNAGTLFSRLVPQMLALGTPDNVRMVYGFD